MQKIRKYKLRNLLGCAFTVILLSSCMKNSDGLNFSLNCDILHKETIRSVEYSDSSVKIIKAEIDKLNKGLLPKPTLSDKHGHLTNPYSLFGRFENCRNMSYYILCYGCIQTGIPQTKWW
jgi:hypothetical protein